MTELDALQTTLGAEHAAVYVYGVLGARTSASGAPELYAALREAYEEHRARRDELVNEIATAGKTPVGAATAYDVAEDLGSVAAVTRAALDLERACADTYAWQVANTTGRRRRSGIDLLTDAAVRGLGFRGTPEIFPGADEHADR